METQSRVKSPIFWLGMVSAAYEAFIGAAVAAGVTLPWYLGALGATLAALLVYCNGNNPSLKQY